MIQQLQRIPFALVNENQHNRVMNALTAYLEDCLSRYKTGAITPESSLYSPLESLLNVVGKKHEATHSMLHEPQEPKWRYHQDFQHQRT